MFEWSARPAAQRLRVKVGSTVDGPPVEVDLKPPALGGIGAHGLITGVALRARTELLDTLLCGLIGTHSPETVRLLLFDGADDRSFHRYGGAPHVVDNFQTRSVPALIEGLTAAGAKRRDELRLQRLPTLHDYDRARHYRPELPVLLPLVVVIHRLSLLPAELTALLREHLAAWREHGIHLLVVEDRPADLPAGLADYFGFELAAGDHGNQLLASGREPVSWTPPPAPDPKALTAGMPKAAEDFRPRWVPYLDEVTKLELDPERGLQGQYSGRGAVPIGDQLGAGRGQPYELPVLLRHTLVVGTQSAVARALRTIALSLALHHTPSGAQLYLLDLNGSALTELAALPLARVALSGADDSLRDRTRDELGELIKRRELLFHQWPTREERAATGQPESVVVLVHGWPDPGLHPGLAEVLRRLVDRGPALEVHVVLGLHRFSALDPGLHGAFGNRLELRLDDPDSSPLPSALRPAGWQGRDGRGVLFQVAAPEALERDLVQEIAEAAPSSVPKLTALPYRVEFSQLGGSGEDFKLGLTEGSGLAYTVRTRHLICFGDPESGRSSLLRAYVRGLVALRTPEQARIVGVDYGRSWFNVDSEGLLLSYVRAAEQFDEAVADIKRALEPRRTAEHGWKGPELHLVIDDYDYLALAQREQLTSLVADADRTGFHLVLAGRYPHTVDGALRKLDRQDTTVCSLSGSGQPTPVSGVRARPLPPGRAIVVQGKNEDTVQVTWTKQGARG